MSTFFIHVGVIRPLPGWDKEELDEFDPIYVISDNNVSQYLLAERTARWGTSDVNCCSYDCGTGDYLWSNWTDCDHEGWVGMEGLDGDETVGLLLDLDKGTLTVYKNGRRLGLMKDGLSGDYCWYTTMSGDRAIPCRSKEARCLKNTVTTWSLDYTFLFSALATKDAM